MTQNFDNALSIFVATVTAIREKNYGPDFPHRENYIVPTLSHGRRYTKIIFGGSVYAFIDRTNGDVLKPASWKAPAKHARGNIFDENNGLGSVGPYGPAYLR